MTGRSDPGPRVAAHRRDGDGVTRIPYPIEVRRATIARVTDVTGHMRRITLTGPELAGMHDYSFDDHVRIVFPWPDGTRTDPVPNGDGMLDWPDPFPLTRKYTIRRFDPDTLELDLDVVRHDGGLAATWAYRAEVGEDVVIAGPPGTKTFPATYRHYVFAVDVTALPAAARWLDEAEWLADGATAHVLIDHDHPDETSYPLTRRPGVDVRWLSRTGGSALADTVTALDLPDVEPERIMVFAAGEAMDIKPLRRWAADRGHASLFTGYWRRGTAGDLT